MRNTNVASSNIHALAGNPMGMPHARATSMLKAMWPARHARRHQ